MDKTCSKCGLKKPLTGFYKNCRKKDGYRSDCKACHTPFVRHYQTTERGKETAQKVERKRTGTETRKRSHGQASRRYKKTPKGRMVRVAADQRRRELARDLDASFSKDDVGEVYQRFGYQCFSCGSQDDLSIDHHRPLSAGYPLNKENAVLLCISCNASKRDQNPEEFYSRTQLEVLNGYGIV